MLAMGKEVSDNGRSMTAFAVLSWYAIRLNRSGGVDSHPFEMSLAYLSKNLWSSSFISGR